MAALNTYEQATLNFYHWEYRYRGYYHFDTPVDIEVPYQPFQHFIPQNSFPKDDGRVPSLFNKITNLFLPPVENTENELEEIQPRFLSPQQTPTLVGFSISFTQDVKIKVERNIEFLNLISFSEGVVSFEVIGNSKDIIIQMVCIEEDKQRIQSHFQAFFPLAIIQETEVSDFGFDIQKDIAIADFGLNEEYMRSTAQCTSFDIDPLTSIIATLEYLNDNDTAVIQVLFKGINSPLAKDTNTSVSDGAEGSFFVDAPEMPKRAKEKTTYPLFSVVMRIATQGKTDTRSQYLAQELARSISAVSHSRYNKLIPLSNEGYRYDFHYYNLHHRLSNRLGFVLNSSELNTFVHYPNNTVVSKKLGIQGGKTKQLPQSFSENKYLIGINHHNNTETRVCLTDEMKLRHIHILGATGVGKSTLLANMVLDDVNVGNGCAIFDPHGDIIEDILVRIPEHRKNDVILIDPSDTEYPIGFNLLQASTDAEKIVLSSDLVSSFKRHATAWGDTMTSVLSNAINTFLESSRNATLIELKRFLIEEPYRRKFLTSVDDPSLLYYWENEYAMVRKSITPLLTRIDTFLRPKVTRYMMAQNTGIDFRQCIEEKKIVLIKLSQGLIGEENSFLLGSLFLSKLNQVAQARQTLPKEQRHPFYVYCDEFQNFITPSISKILSGTRKYGLGLILANQELAQIDEPKTLNSVISNPYTRICFRLGDKDAKQLESGFSYFEQQDLQQLGIGQAIIRIGSSNTDANVQTFPLLNNSNEKVRQYIITHTRNQYTQEKSVIEKFLIDLLPHSNNSNSVLEGEKIKKAFTRTKKEEISKQRYDKETGLIPSQGKEKQLKTEFEEKKDKYLKQSEKQDIIRDHIKLQDYVRVLAQQRGFKAIIEEPTISGGFVDVGLTKNKITIAVEISVTNTISYEVQNIKKCLKSNYSYVLVISESKIHLKNIKEKVSEVIHKNKLSKVFFYTPNDIVNFFDTISPPKIDNEKRIKGYRINTKFNDKKEVSTLSKTQELTNLILSTIRKNKEKK